MTTAKMDGFNEYWTIEKARRRRLWPTRYKSFLRQHLSLEEIKTRVFRYGFNDNIAIELRQRYFCANNPVIYPVSEESLKTRLENLGADTKTFSMATNVKYGLHYMQTYKDVTAITDIHLEEIVVRIKKTFRDDDETSIRYDVYPYHVMNDSVDMVLTQEEFHHLDIATLLMEMVADYRLRKEEILYYSKRQRIDNMYGIVAPDITFRLLDDDALRKKLKECKRKSLSMERMLREVARSWMISTDKYITLVTKTNWDTAWQSVGKDLYRELRTAFKEIDNESMVIMTEHDDIIIECLGYNYTILGEHPWTKDNINIRFFPEIPEITICSNDISTKALVGYIRQAAEFNMEMTEYLKKAQAMYKKMRKRYFKRHATKILTSYSK